MLELQTDPRLALAELASCVSAAGSRASVVCGGLSISKPMLPNRPIRLAQNFSITLSVGLRAEA